MNKLVSKKIGLEDVQLLVRVVYACRNGQMDVPIGHGVKAAAVRLCKAGLLQPPSGVTPARTASVQPTLEAHRLVRERFATLIQWEAETLD